MVEYVKGFEPGPTIQSYEVPAAGDSFDAAGLAARAGVSLALIRRYVAAGLLTPQKRGRDHYYSAADHHRLGILLSYRRMGLSASKIMRLLHRSDGRGKGQADILRLHLGALVARYDKLQREIDGIDAALRHLRRHGSRQLLA